MAGKVNFVMRALDSAGAKHKEDSGSRDPATPDSGPAVEPSPSSVEPFNSVMDASRAIIAGFPRHMRSLGEALLLGPAAQMASMERSLDACAAAALAPAKRALRLSLKAVVSQLIVNILTGCDGDSLKSVVGDHTDRPTTQSSEQPSTHSPELAEAFRAVVREARAELHEMCRRGQIPQRSSSTGDILFRKESEPDSNASEPGSESSSSSSAGGGTRWRLPAWCVADSCVCIAVGCLRWEQRRRFDGGSGPEAVPVGTGSPCPTVARAGAGGSPTSSSSNGGGSGCDSGAPPPATQVAVGTSTSVEGTEGSQMVSNRRVGCMDWLKMLSSTSIAEILLADEAEPRGTGARTKADAIAQ